MNVKKYKSLIWSKVYIEFKLVKFKEMKNADYDKNM